MKPGGEERGALEGVVRSVEPRGRLLAARPLQGGVSSRMTMLQIGLPGGASRRVVLRRPSSWSLQRNPTAAGDEFRLLRGLHDAGLSVPEPLHVDETGAVLTEPHLVLEHVEGRTVLDRASAGRVLRPMAARLADVHRFSASRPEVSALPHLEQEVTELLARRVGRETSETERRLRDELARAWPLPRRNPHVLLHGDYWPGNLLWRGEELVAVIDWEDAAVGDPLADLAISRLDVLWTFGPEAMDAFTAHHEAVTDLDRTDLPYWDLHAALRAAPHFVAWSAGWPELGRPDITAPTMREGHELFAARALAAIADR